MPRDRNYLSAAGGGAEASSPETALRTRVNDLCRTKLPSIHLGGAGTD